MNIIHADKNNASLESINAGDVFFFVDGHGDDYYIKTADYISGTITVVNLDDGSVGEFPPDSKVTCVKHKLVIE